MVTLRPKYSTESHKRSECLPAQFQADPTAFYQYLSKRHSVAFLYTTPRIKWYRKSAIPQENQGLALQPKKICSKVFFLEAPQAPAADRYTDGFHGPYPLEVCKINPNRVSRNNLCLSPSSEEASIKLTHVVFLGHSTASASPVELKAQNYGSIDYSKRKNTEKTSILCQQNPYPAHHSLCAGRWLATDQEATSPHFPTPNRSKVSDSECRSFTSTVEEAIHVIRLARL